MIQMCNNTSGNVRSAVAQDRGTWQGNCTAGLVHHQIAGFSQTFAYGYLSTAGTKPQSTRLWRPREDST